MQRCKETKLLEESFRAQGLPTIRALRIQWDAHRRVRSRSRKKSYRSTLEDLTWRSKSVMAASSPKPPLFLFQVLEDEYAALHGEQPPDLDWQFRANHIIYAESLIKRLGLTSFNKPQSAQKENATPQKAKRPRRQIKAIADPDEVAKNALIKYLHDGLARKKFSSSASGAQLVADALNTFLADPNLFAEERFSNYWLNSATRGMRELHTSYTIMPSALGFSGGPLTRS
jgi:hypothetical protein